MFLIPAVGFAVCFALLLPYQLDKELGGMQAEILQRHKDEAAARGKVYVSPEEKARQEQALLEQEAEEKRLAELKAKCEKKGLDFAAEEAKYQAKLSARKKK